MRFRSLLGFAATATLLAGCGGLKDALTAHVDVVARAGSQELSVTRLSDLLGNAKIQVPVTKDNTAIVADIWAGYQQMAYAAAHGDSLTDHKAIDVAVAPMINAQKLQRFMDSVSKTFKPAPPSEAAYNQAAGGLLAARHILIGYKNPGVPASSAEKDSVHKKAMQIRAQVTDANFSDLVVKYSSDPTAKQNKGNMGVFNRAAMVAPFSVATAALKPGEISQPIETQFGWHIIQRLPYSAAATDFATQYSQASMMIADSTYMAQTEKAANVQVKPNAPATMKSTVKESAKHLTDRSVLATYNGGDLTVADYLGWLETFPPQQQISQRIPTVPDSVLLPFAKQLAVRQVLLKKADSAKIDIPAQDRAQMYTELGQLVSNVWQALGVDPKQLADSAKSTAEKERLAASRVDAFLDRMMAGQAQPLSLPTPLKKLLSAKYEASVNSAGIDRAFERAQRVRASADSAKEASQPKSQIPMPGAGGPPSGAPPAGATTPPAGAPPTGAPPATAPKKP
jgi:hypothetical protein